MRLDDLLTTSRCVGCVRTFASAAGPNAERCVCSMWRDLAAGGPLVMAGAGLPNLEPMIIGRRAIRRSRTIR